MTKEEHNCDNVNCNHNNTKGLCCLFNPDNCKYRQLQKENTELKADNDARKFAMAMSEKVEKQLREENANLNDVLEGYKKIAKWCDKCELEKKISILLSCKNCPENKGGLICQKEYEDKCLAQKIEFIKELQKENAELKDDSKVMADNYSKMEQKFFDNLTKAKELLKRYVPYRQITDSKAYKDLAEETEQFISEVEKGEE